MNRKILLITANVGSLFDESDAIEPFWVNTVVRVIVEHNPVFVAIHFQEVGGKCYRQLMWKMKRFVEQFRRRIIDSVALSSGVCFLDEEFSNDDKFTALGNLFLIHQQLEKDIKIWNFKKCMYKSLHGFHIYESDLDSLPVLERIKFPAEYFPEGKLTRKGVLRTRWKLQNTEVELANVHLFHDACNLVASKMSPSVYSGFRKRALNYTLSRIRDTEAESRRPMFIFGDFNFRLDAKSVIEHLLVNKDIVLHENSNGMLFQYKQDSTEEVVLQLGPKEFKLRSESLPNYEDLLKFDKERHEFADLLECEISFAPSYPYIEDPSLPVAFMKTRIPAWCDRVLMNKSAWDWLSSLPKGAVNYNIVGQDVCTGDHKPVMLVAELPQTVATGSSKELNCSLL